jgi:hypothetical protein
MAMALEDITGLSLTLTGVLLEKYVGNGYADPTMYRALRATAELAERFHETMEADEAPAEVLSEIRDLITNLQLTAMEAGEVVNKLIDENNLPIDKSSWHLPDCDHDHEEHED